MAANPWSRQFWSPPAQYRLVRLLGGDAANALARDAALAARGVYNRDPRPTGTESLIIDAAIGVDVLAILSLDFPGFVLNAGLGLSMAAAFTLQLEGSDGLGFDVSAVVTREVRMIASAALGLDQAATVDAQQAAANLVAAMAFGLDQGATLTREQYIATTSSLGFDQATTPTYETYLVAVGATLGFTESATVTRELDLVAAPDVGFSEAASPAIEFNLTASHALGFGEVASIMRELDLIAAPAVGFSEAASVTRILGITAAPAVGFSEAASITTAVLVTPATTTFDSGSGNFTVPNYDTLVVEAWGGGAPGKGQNSGGTAFFGTVGTDSTVSTLSLVAGKGAIVTTTNGGAGGTATGGDVNTSGGAGGNTVSGTGVVTGGKGGDSPQGGPGGPAQTTPSNSQVNGVVGTAPGGGGSGGGFRNSGIPVSVMHAGGGAGAYVKKVYSLGVGSAPSVGASIAYSVGTGGVKGTTSFADGGNGAAGRVRFNVLSSTSPDGNDSNTKLLMHFDGSNGALFASDSSASSHNWTMTGTVALDTSKKTFGVSSCKFPGVTGSHINGDSTASADFTFGSGDFTIDFHIIFNSVAGTQVIYDGRPAATVGVYPLLFLTGGNLQWFVNNAARISGAPAGGWATATDYHVAIVKASGSTIMYVNGTQVGSTYTDANTYLAVPNSSPRIGESIDGASALNANMDELRISKGVARWTSGFTPPAAAYS